MSEQLGCVYRALHKWQTISLCYKTAPEIGWFWPRVPLEKKECSWEQLLGVLHIVALKGAHLLFFCAFLSFSFPSCKMGIMLWKAPAVYIQILSTLDNSRWLMGFIVWGFFLSYWWILFYCLFISARVASKSSGWMIRTPWESFPACLQVAWLDPRLWFRDLQSCWGFSALARWPCTDAVVCNARLPSLALGLSCCQR